MTTLYLDVSVPFPKVPPLRRLADARSMVSGRPHVDSWTVYVHPETLDELMGADTRGVVVISDQWVPRHVYRFVQHGEGEDSRHERRLC